MQPIHELTMVTDPKVCLESGAEMLPCFVVGFRCPGIPALESPEDELPDYCVGIEHQHGGIACSQATIVGVVLRLRDNARFAKISTDELRDALEYWTSDVRYSVRDTPDVEVELRRCFELPRVVSSSEALFGFAGDPRPFLGWKVWRPQWRTGQHSVRVDECLIEWLTNRLGPLLLGRAPRRN